MSEKNIAVGLKAVLDFLFRRLGASAELEALRDMLDDARTQLDMIREALGVSVEPHQDVFERMLRRARDAAKTPPQACACDLWTSVLGDGCEVCNPAQALEYAKQTIADQKEEIAALERDAAEVTAARQYLKEQARQLTRIAELERENKVLALKSAGTLANNMCPDHRDKQVGKPCLACTIETLERVQGVLVGALEAAGEELAAMKASIGYRGQTLKVMQEVQDALAAVQKPESGEYFGIPFDDGLVPADAAQQPEGGDK